MKFKELLSKFRKYFGDGGTGHFTDEEINEYLNEGQRKLMKICSVCKKRFKSYRGKRIHAAKKHGLTNKKLEQMRNEVYMKKVRIKLKNTPQVRKYNEALKKASKMTKEEIKKRLAFK